MNCVSEFTYKWPYMIYSKYTLLFWDVSWGLGVEKEKEKFPWVLGKGWAPGYGGGGWTAVANYGYCGQLH